ncbi:hypothetical protein INR49_023518 [Caranx melampygus]|nr:hypothetical protein INR49_023518 [Caranx melampygus]
MLHFMSKEQPQQSSARYSCSDKEEMDDAVVQGGVRCCQQVLGQVGLVHGQHEDKVFLLDHHPVARQRLLQGQQQGVRRARESLSGAPGGRALCPPHFEGVVGVAGVAKGVLTGRVSGLAAQQRNWTLGGSLIVAVQHLVVLQTSVVAVVLGGGQVGQLALVDAERSQPHQRAHGEPGSSHVTVLLTLHVHICNEAPGQREEGEETRAGGEMDRHHVHGGHQSFTEQETTAEQEILTGHWRGSGGAEMSQ